MVKVQRCEWFGERFNYTCLFHVTKCYCRKGKAWQDTRSWHILIKQDIMFWPRSLPNSIPQIVSQTRLPTFFYTNARTVVLQTKSIGFIKQREFHFHSVAVSRGMFFSSNFGCFSLGINSQQTATAFVLQCRRLATETSTITRNSPKINELKLRCT